jgi:MFS family permease
MISARLFVVARAPLAAFAAMGVVWGGFAAELPDIKTMLGVDESRLGLLLFMTPLAAVVAMLVAPWVGERLGRIALPGAAIAMAAAFVLPGQVGPMVWLFPLAMMVCGAATGLTDVLMNARVADLEGRTGLHMMNLCHAGYSFGYAGGAISVGIMRDAGWPPAAVLGALGLIAAVLAVLTPERDGRIASLARPKDRAAAHLGLLPLLGGAMVLIAFLTENAAENWSALHIEKTLGGSPAHGAMGPAVMALTMGMARLVGQGMAARVDPVRLLTMGAAVSATGALIAGAAVNPAMAYFGFMVMGIGSSVIAPTTFSLVARRAEPQSRARAVARTTLFGYFGYFIGPPLFGYIAGHLGLRLAFVVAAALLVFVPVMARMIGKLRL